MVDGKWYSAVALHIKNIKDPNVPEEERCESAKGLATLASSEVANERMSRQNLIIEQGAGSILIRMMMHSESEQERWWASLALVQLTLANERTIMNLVDVSVLGKSSLVVKRWMIGDEAVEDEMIKDENLVCAVKACSMVLANEVAYSTDRIKYGAMHILTNIANKCWDVHDLVFAHGAVRKAIPICRSSNTPALVAAAVGLLTSMSYNETSRRKLLTAGCLKVLESIARTEREDLNAVSANIAKNNLKRYAVSLMIALAKGWMDRRRLRKEANARRMKRLGNFFGNLVFYKCFLIWAHDTKDAIEQRAKLKLSMKRLLNRTLVWALQKLSLYVDRRHGKYEKFDKAEEFAGKSLVARNRLLGKWVEYMRKHGPWWRPGDELEAQVQEKCKNFIALMSGQWVGLCFGAWKELLVKKRRAMRRWQNSALYYGLGCWTEYMYTEGPWWEPDAELKRLLDEKCGKFLAQMSGDFVQLAFREWDLLIKKNKRARARWFNKCLTDCFDTWHDEIFVETYALYQEVQTKCSKVIALIGGDFIMRCFKLWKDDAQMNAKGKRFLYKLKNRPMVDAWEKWIDLMFDGEWWTPDAEMQALLDQKCGKIIAMLGGDLVRLVLKQWCDLAQKQRKAMKRWKNQTIHHAWKDWFQFNQDALWYKGKARIIRAKRRIFELADATVDWKDITDERRYNRSLVGDAILMWSNRELVWAFRSLDEHAQLEIWRREVIRRFRLRFELRPAQRMLRIWLDWTDQQIRLRLLVSRIKNRFVIEAMRQWSEVIHNEKIAARERLVNASPKLMRWLKRPLVTTLGAWKELVDTEVRNRMILKKMKYRMDHGCVIMTFANWNEYVDIVVAERFHVLKAAVANALRTGTLMGLMASLKREQQTFQRRNVRWDEFARAYMQDALEEFSAEESGHVAKIYKQVVARRGRREKEQQERLKQFSFGAAGQQQSSPSPPKRRALAESLSPERGDEGAEYERGVRGRHGRRDASPARSPKRQIAPGYMSKSLGKRGGGGGGGVGLEERREGRHLGAVLRERERGEREERGRERRRAEREAQKAREAAERQDGGRGGSAPLPPRGSHNGDVEEVVSLPRIEPGGKGGMEQGGEDWPWADKRAVSFALGEEGPVGLPKLVPQKNPVIL